VDFVAEQPTERSHNAVQAARRRLRALGHDDARPAENRSGEASFDVVSAHAVAVVESGRSKVDVEAVQRFAGAAGLEGKVGCLFSAGGFTDAAIAWADAGGVALFMFDPHGDAAPVGRVAADAVGRCAAAETLPGTSDLADPIAVAGLLTAGLVGGAVGEIDLWFGGAGQVLTFWVDPGDRETAASVTLALYPDAVGQHTADPGPGWERREHKPPGGGTERMWVRRCVHANQAPTVVAGEAVAQAAVALDVCDVDFDKCRLELRPPPEHDEAVAQDMHRARQTVLGPLGEGVAMPPAPGEVADSARIYTALIDRARAQDDGGAAAELAGLTAGGDPAWRFVARHQQHGRFGSGRWEIEVRVPDRLLDQEQGGWLRPAKASVGGTQWSRSGGEWCTAVVGDNLEIAAHEAVIDLAAAYTMAGRSLEETALERPG
jgi:hypothetical protein